MEKVKLRDALSEIHKMSELARECIYSNGLPTEVALKAISWEANQCRELFGIVQYWERYLSDLEDATKSKMRSPTTISSLADSENAKTHSSTMTTHSRSGCWLKT